MPAERLSFLRRSIPTASLLAMRSLSVLVALTGDTAFAAQRTEATGRDATAEVGTTPAAAIKAGTTGVSTTEVDPAERVGNAELCDGLIARVTFQGNRVTRAHVLKRELSQRIGVPCALEDALAGQARLVDLGLFRSVHSELHPIPLPVPLEAMAAHEAAQSGEPINAALHSSHDPAPAPRELLELRYVVREKFFFLGLPRFSRTSDGEVRAGISLEWSNFLGRLHEMQLTSEWRQEDDGQGRGGFVHSLDYDVPRFLGSDMGMSVSLDLADRQVGFKGRGQDAPTDIGEGQLESYAARVTLARWASGSNGVQGLRYFYGTSVNLRDYTLLSGRQGESLDGFDLGWRIGIEQRSVHRERYRRRGLRLGSAFSFANRKLGSDFDWHRVDSWLAWYRPVGTGLDNLNIALTLGISDGAPFGDRFYAIGGGELLRGVEKGAREGDARLLMNVEYLRGLRRWPAFRFVVFADVGNVWSIDDVDIADVLLRPGIGARYKLEALSRRDLRIDLAWDPEEESVVPYLSTRLTF